MLKCIRYFWLLRYALWLCVNTIQDCITYLVSGETGKPIGQISKFLAALKNTDKKSALNYFNQNMDVNTRKHNLNIL